MRFDLPPALQHIEKVLERLLDEQLDDGGWYCWRNDAAAPGHVCPGIRITAQLVLSRDPAAALDSAQPVYDAPLARARWMTRVGYRLLLT